MAEKTTYENRRKFKSEPYLRAEHLLKDGKYVSALIEIVDIVYDCPKKKLGSTEMGKMLGLAIKGTDKILGLCATNEGMVAHITGCGNPPDWIGKKVQLVVRLAGNKKEPAIRVWPGRGNPHPNNRVREQMGEEITEEWYRTHAWDNHEEPAKETKPEQQKKSAEPKKIPDKERQEWITKVEDAIRGCKVQADLNEARSKFTNLGPYLEKHSTPLTDEELKRISDLLAETAKSIPAQQDDKPEGALV